MIRPPARPGFIVPKGVVGTSTGRPRKWLNSAGMAEMSHFPDSNFSLASAFK